MDLGRVADLILPDQTGLFIGMGDAEGLPAFPVDDDIAYRFRCRIVVH